MANLRSGLAVMAICMTASGCAVAPQPPAPPAPVVAPPTQPVSVNGTYSGITQLVQESAMSCGTQDMFTLHVVDNAFDYTINQPQVPWQPVRSFTVAIAPDGSFQAQSGAAYIRGTVSGGHMAGDIMGDACGYHFEADSTGTF
jgi:hypothetical protein